MTGASGKDERIPWYRFRPTVGSTVGALLGVAVLIALGTWQLDRLAWKNALIAARQAGLAAAPVALPVEDAGLEALLWHPVRLTGRFLHDEELHLAARSMNGNVGYHILTPFVREAGPTVLVNRGWVPNDRRDAATRSEGQVEGTVTVVGLVTPGAGRNAFTPDNQPAENFWFSADYAQMSQAVGRDLQPVVVDADATPNPGGLPIGGQTRTDLPNDHLQYAITWYLLAAALVAVYVAWNRKRMRQEDAVPP